MKVLVTGSSGLIGSEIVTFFDARADSVLGIDNNMRADFFGREGDTEWNLRRLRTTTRHFRHWDLDIRDRNGLQDLYKREAPFDLIVHCAAQPSHDLAATRPFDDFDINAMGTLNLLEATRRMSPDAVFILLSTNKVYGDAPNELPLKELPTRWEYARGRDYAGISEAMRVRSFFCPFGLMTLMAMPFTPCCTKPSTMGICFETSSASGCWADAGGVALIVGLAIIAALAIGMTFLMIRVNRRAPASQPAASGSFARSRGGLLLSVVIPIGALVRLVVALQNEHAVIVLATSMRAVIS